MECLQGIANEHTGGGAFCIQRHLPIIIRFCSHLPDSHVYPGTGKLEHRSNHRRPQPGVIGHAGDEHSHAAIFAWVGVWLAFLVNSDLTRPLADMTAVLQRIRDGHLEARVRVTTNYALGYVGDAVNVASRPQDASKQHGTSIIVSADTQRRFSR